MIHISIECSVDSTDLKSMNGRVMAFLDALPELGAVTTFKTDVGLTALTPEASEEAMRTSYTESQGG